MPLEKKYRVYLPIVFAVVMVLGMWAGIKLAPQSDPHGGMFAPSGERYNKVSDLMSYILSNYVDSVSKDELAEDAILGILEELDPHSQYISADILAQVNEDLMGNFEGIGIQFSIESDTITVIQTIADGPSEKVGLLAGDRIVIVDDSLVAGVGIGNNGAIKMLKGPRGTKVAIKVYRRGVKELLDFTIVRDVIPTFSVDVAYMSGDTIGYIKVSKFSATTYKEFTTALKVLVDRGMKTLILDLRGNTGGYLEAATYMADEFLGSGQLIVYTEGENRPRNYAYATKKGLFEDNDLIVLINEGSASASVMLLLVSSRSIPLSTLPSAVKAAYWRYLSSTARFGSTMATSKVPADLSTSVLRSVEISLPTPSSKWQLLQVNSVNCCLPRTGSPSMSTTSWRRSSCCWISALVVGSPNSCPARPAMASSG